MSFPMLADAKNSVAANGSDGNISEQTAKVKAAINNLFYAKMENSVRRAHGKVAVSRSWSNFFSGR